VVWPKGKGGDPEKQPVSGEPAASGMDSFGLQGEIAVFPPEILPW